LVPDNEGGVVADECWDRTHPAIHLDADLRMVNKRIQLPKTLVTSRFSRPTVTIGANGALVSDRLGLKTGYL
jgi:hypothetical protein